MVKAQENWSDIECIVKELTEDPTRPGWISASVQVVSADSVEGQRNMLATSVGKTISLILRKGGAAIATLEPGSIVRTRARLSAPNVAFVGPDGVRVGR